MKLNETKSALAIAFAIVVSLMMLMLFTGLSVMHGSDQRIRSLVDNHSRKTELLVKMRTAARERTVSLQNWQQSPIAMKSVRGSTNHTLTFRATGECTHKHERQW